jgi:Beta-propeller repeat
MLHECIFLLLPLTLLFYIYKKFINMKRVFVFILCAIFLTTKAQVPNFQWAKQFTGSVNVILNAMAREANGNIISTGECNGLVDFDPGIGIVVPSIIGAEDCFISKLDASGNYLWVKTIGGSSSAIYSQTIAIDSNANIFIGGFFNGTIDFDPSATQYNISSSGYEDIFIAKYDSNGSFVWAKQIGEAQNNESVNAITIDPFGNVYTTGRFKFTMDFDPGVGVHYLTAPVIGGSTATNAFILKLDNNGNFKWAKNFGNTNYEEGYDITTDNDGNVYTIGDFQGTVDFDPGIGIFNLVQTNNFSDGAYISKLDSNGNFVFARGFYEAAYGRSISVDSQHNIFTTGKFTGSVDFDPSLSSFIVAATSYGAFISKLNTSGNFLWAKGISGINPISAMGNSITQDIGGNVYVTGVYAGTIDFDPGTPIFNLSSNPVNNKDFFVLKLNPLGILEILFW